jgi:hypothetical protein
VYWQGTMASLKTLYEPNTNLGNALHTNFESVTPLPLQNQS